MATKINFACHQNSVPILNELRLSNICNEASLEAVDVQLEASPAFVRPKTWRIDRIGPQGSVHVRDRDIQLDGQFLLDLTESMQGIVTVRAETGGVELASVTHRIELLAYNEWGGAGYMPELLAAFATPNAEAVASVLKAASNLLRNANKKDSIEGYQSGSRKRVWELVSAIYGAIANKSLTYAEPPASFERDGQKIRLPDDVERTGLATCLDLVMLFSAVTEQAGLNPIVVLQRGHALVGVWLQPEELSAVVVDDAETLRKRLQLNELILIETTFTTSRTPVPFSAAVTEGARTIIPDKDDEFAAAVDIRRARMHRFNPLSIRAERRESSAADTAEARSVEVGLEEAPALPDFDVEAPEEQTDETPASRLERWQRRLLDLTLNNRLLNHKASKTSLTLICPEPGRLEDKLAAGKKISIQPTPERRERQQDQDLHTQRTGEVISEEYAREALDSGQVLVDLPKEEVQKRAIEIYRKTQTALQEGGANTLYLALGFLLWKRDEKDTRRFRAPLILLPVSLERRSVRSGVKLVAHDDEPRFNTTLLEMLKKDFSITISGLEGELPQDESGIDVDGIWNIVRKAVKEAPGFEVVEDVVLGHFSFAKYLMWKDLVDRTEMLKQNAVVRHLIENPRDLYETSLDFPEPRLLDQTFKPADIFTPLPADSSQVAAIAGADRGKDFVIIGPPGTGKSQSISNLITHLLATERTVLFVSEKTAALEVVYRRLKDVGLSAFCLQLHSNKARKADVLNQLRSAWGATEEQTQDTWEQQAQELKGLRDSLNQVVERLHARHPNGMTAYQAIGVSVRDANLAILEFAWPTANQHNEAALQSMREAVSNLAVQAKQFDDVTNSPLNLVTASDWSPQWEQHVVQRAGELASDAGTLGRATAEFCSTVGIELPDRSLERLQALVGLSDALLEAHKTQAVFALEAQAQERLEALELAVERLRAYAAAQPRLSCAYDAEAWRKVDGKELEHRWLEADAHWWPKSWLRKRAIRKELRAAGARGKPDPVHDAPILAELKEQGQAIDELSQSLNGLAVWRAHDTNPADAEQLAALGARVRSITTRLADDAASLGRLREAIRATLGGGNDLLAPEGAVGRAAQRFKEAYGRFQDSTRSFEAVAGGSVQERFLQHEDAPAATGEMAEALVKRHQELRDWCAWRRAREAAIDVDLGRLVDSIEAGHVAPADSERVFWASYCKWWSAAVIGEDEVLRRFSSAEQNARIERFRELDEEFQRTTAAYVNAKLRSALPSQNTVKRASEWGVLQHELQKKKRHKPVRQLVQEIPSALTKLTPCIMMSPLSIAQYLPADQDLFDVVIFDEASQITVWDAVGAIARGRQTIVAGDPKQMPPTNFFNRADDDPDGDVDTDGDLESILDELLGASIPHRKLNWHYRSRRESLIAFSNHRYYDGSLVTFPAPAVVDEGVRLMPVDGHYERGGARCNHGEAKAIVAECVRRLTQPDSGVSQQSIGVVTFNSEQQRLIEDLLDAERNKRPDIEAAFSSEHTSEPVFVKNLETVQGDERDVILFSVTYGPDQSGHVTMNFGPLNREGGERRLNVALTRARSELLVFSTLKAEQIDLSRTQARAVRDLKHFLEFAERGPAALGEAVFGSMGEIESPFEAAVVQALRDKGWEVHSQIGVSAYRVDIGVVHPDVPGTYLAGVECDGATYHSSATARDRDKIRQRVLEGLGWTLVRTWSTDWWTYPGKARDQVDVQLRQILEQDRSARAEAEARANQAYETAAEDGNEFEADLSNLDDSSVEPDPAEVDDAERGLIDENNGASSTAAATIGPDEHQAFRREPTSSKSGVDPAMAPQAYHEATFDQSGMKADADRFYDNEYDRTLREMVDHVIDVEGPIHEDVVVRRIARHHGFQRAGRRIRDRVLTLAAKRRGSTNEPQIGRFYWPKGTVKDRLVQPRVYGRDDELRNVRYICAEELAAIGKAIGAQDDPVQIARAIGLARLETKARDRIAAACQSSEQ